MASAQRILGHELGLRALKNGDYNGAISILEEALRAHGPHVALLSDLAGAAYLKGDMGAFELAVERLEAEFAEVAEHIARESRIRTHVTLAKFFEELGRIADAFEQIEEALKRLPSGDPLAFHVRCQKLRLLASFGKEDELTELYHQCLRVSEEKPQLLIECFHALPLSEVRLFGWKQTWPRLEALKGSKELQAADLRLCAIDLLEVALEKADVPAQNAVLEFIHSQKISGFDAYERWILHLASRSASLTAQDLFVWSRELSRLGFLRLLALAMVKTSDRDERSELQKKFVFQVQSYDHRTQKILYKKWARLFDAVSDSGMVLELRNQSVHAGDNSLSLKASPLSWALLECLCEGETDPSGLLTKLSKSGDSIQDLESIRIALLRLNKKMAAFLAVDWVFKYRKSGVLVNDQIRLKRA